ncbi:MAG: bifunctional hydroxymethylpyrimidine kinase/phosphomethylpyrimidine kinase [Peptococcaceae bacterium]|nr:bifunctional hydroxymethylpyrimidine kinase/phosphomethylpyrimidine kinase [Peptococcaceae bacterium]
MKKVLSIAGSDCSGGAGIQADLKTFSAHGVFGMSAIVSVVAENTSRVIDIQDVAPTMIEKQIDAVFEDIEVDAVKIGMLSQGAAMEAVAGKLRQYAPANVVIDPVMYAKNGCPLMDPASIDTLIKTVIPLGDLITPNIPEAEKIAGMTIANAVAMEKAAVIIHQMGCQNVLIKGGHAVKGGRSGNDDQADDSGHSGEALDILFDGKEFTRYSAERIDTKNTHGTGCTFSSAIAANLALGFNLGEAVSRAKAYVTTAIRYALPIGKGHGPTHHFYGLYKYGLELDHIAGD